MRRFGLTRAELARAGMIRAVWYAAWLQRVRALARAGWL